MTNSLPAKKRTKIRVTVTFKGGVVSFDAPFWWTDDACVRHAKESLSPMRYSMEEAVIERETCQ